ncbi:unnamed protein product [Bursaphelenchus okinawaensis]|uniref:Uncharacterized protein n=1 Tax=Bursaphelenchus okinawaensis TaxID=465554 RepID=A0A811LMP5_9BILA|nr:unnamed protein product [Bursaphelenchus okinawaensis]CAG9124401.1 unnamed protein product [Bursaphelenchus okinawaensis]
MDLNPIESLPKPRNGSFYTWDELMLFRQGQQMYRRPAQLVHPHHYASAYLQQSASSSSSAMSASAMSSSAMGRTMYFYNQ